MVVLLLFSLVLNARSLVLPAARTLVELYVDKVLGALHRPATVVAMCSLLYVFCFSMRFSAFIVC